jgi:hypothetical protein
MEVEHMGSGPTKGAQAVLGRESGVPKQELGNEEEGCLDHAAQKK